MTDKIKTDAEYVAAARDLWHEEGFIEIDQALPEVSRRERTEGAYVKAWVWVPEDYEIREGL